MIIYKDILTGDEMFSDNYQIKLIDGVLYEVTGKLIQLDGANPSDEEADQGADEGTDTAVEYGIDVASNHRLCERSFGDKKSFNLYLKDYILKVVAKLEERAPDQVEVFQSNVYKAINNILDKFKNLQFFTGESMDYEGAVAMVECRDVNGESVPFLYFFKHGLEEEES